MNNESVDKEEVPIEKAEDGTRFMSGVNEGVLVLAQKAEECEESVNRLVRFVNDEGYQNVFARGLSESDDIAQIGRLMGILQGEFQTFGDKLRSAKKEGNRINVAHAKNEFVASVDAVSAVADRLYGVVADVYGTLERARSRFDWNTEEAESVTRMMSFTRQAAEEVEGMGKFLKSFGNDLVR